MFAPRRFLVQTKSQHALPFSRGPSTGTITKPRTFVTEAIQAASDGFLDLALALPFPEAIPPYSGTIITLTVFSRFLTVPFSVWVSFWYLTSTIFVLTAVQAKKRQWKTEEVVLPQLLQERPLIFEKVHEEMKKVGFTGTREEAMTEHAKRSQPMVRS